MIRAGSTMADFDKMDEEDEAAGYQAYYLGVQFYTGASVAWRNGWVRGRNEMRALPCEEQVQGGCGWPKLCRPCLARTQ